MIPRRGKDGGGSSRKCCWVLLILATCCGLYVLMYYRAALTTNSILLFPRLAHPLQLDTSTGAPDSSPVKARALAPLPILNSTWNASRWSAVQALKEAIMNRSAPPLLTMFSTWGERDNFSLVRNLTLWNWVQLKPFVVPILFTNDSRVAAHANQSGWHVLPISRTAIGIPILKNMYLDVMKKFNSTLYAFANGDILFTESLVASLITILTNSSLNLNKNPLFVVGTRINVPNVTSAETLTFSNLTKAAKARGKVFTISAEDYFITDRRFPWDNVPGVVIGRRAYDNWLVLHAIKNKHVVVDVTNTALAVHQTTKEGNFAGHHHYNPHYNDQVLRKLYKRINYGGGYVVCAPWQTLKSPDGKLYVKKRGKRPKYC